MGLTNQIDQFNKIAGFMTADSDLWVASRFERLHLINLLSIQRRLSALDEEINDHLRYDRYLTGEAQYPEPSRTSEEVLAELQSTIKAYSDAISSLAILKESEVPASHTVKALKESAPQSSAFFKELNSPHGLEHATSRQLSVATEPRNWVHKYVARHERLARLFREEHSAGHVYYTKFSEKRLKKTEFGIVAICLCLVQLLPVLALTLVSSKAVRVTVIVILIIVVSVVNSLFTNTVRATNFGAVAAYSAIVVVFVSQSNGN